MRKYTYMILNVYMAFLVFLWCPQTIAKLANITPITIGLKADTSIVVGMVYYGFPH